jgi:hypothetical protein
MGLFSQHVDLPFRCRRTPTNCICAGTQRHRWWVHCTDLSSCRLTRRGWSRRPRTPRAPPFHGHPDGRHASTSTGPRPPPLKGGGASKGNIIFGRYFPGRSIPGVSGFDRTLWRRFRIWQKKACACGNCAEPPTMEITRADCEPAEGTRSSTGHGPPRPAPTSCTPSPLARSSRGDAAFIWDAFPVIQRIAILA